jgi:butyryl-CoA dehydrogenase
MQFSISEELKLTRSVVRDFAESELAPHAEKRDASGQPDRVLFEKIALLGLTGIPIEERYGGAGGSWLMYTVVIEELSRVCASTAAALNVHTLFAAWPIYAYGSEETKKTHLQELTSGQRIGGCALPQAKQASITARLKGTQVVLNGKHPFVIHGEASDYTVVFAQSRVSKSKKGWSVYLVENSAADYRTGNKIQMLGLRSLMVSEVEFRHYSIPVSSRIGREGQDQEIAFSLVDIGHIGAAAQSLGLAQGALEAAVKYAKLRKQFGILIGKQQGISFKLADMSAKIEAARLLTYQAAWRRDEGLDCGRAAAIARKYTADMAVAVAIEAIQIFGGYGYMQEYQMERWLRDAKCLQSDMGTGGMKTNYISHILPG